MTDDKAYDDCLDDRFRRDVACRRPVERLDATVFGLIKALVSARADLPQLLDEALKISLWARQIAREDEDVAPLHKKVFEARANLTWKTTTAQACARR